MKNGVIDDRNEAPEIIENLVVIVRVSGPFGRATCCPFYREDSECQEGHRKTHGGQGSDDVVEHAAHSFILFDFIQEAEIGPVAYFYVAGSAFGSYPN